ncbi:VrrB protein [Hyphomicrobium methylovorum]|uniref:VrrB protein n=1 Tax=Hyphomicrobium methylovorum TaxID=84 RepID=UPI0015E6BA56|nr:VrrB protein [Hyphomicrobium methylovorum]MBA2127553.1 VrrB protein [Hyphomicrobium methylovorum]
MRKLFMSLSVLGGLLAFAGTSPASANAAAGLTKMNIEKPAPGATQVRYRHRHWGHRHWRHRGWRGGGLYFGFGAPGWGGYGYYPRRYRYGYYGGPSYYYGGPRWRHRHWGHRHWGHRHHRHWGHRGGHRHWGHHRHR